MDYALVVGRAKLPCVAESSGSQTSSAHERAPVDLHSRPHACRSLGGAEARSLAGAGIGHSCVCVCASDCQRFLRGGPNSGNVGCSRGKGSPDSNDQRHIGCVRRALRGLAEPLRLCGYQLEISTKVAGQPFCALVWGGRAGSQRLSKHAPGRSCWLLRLASFGADGGRLFLLDEAFGTASAELVLQVSRSSTMNYSPRPHPTTPSAASPRVGCAHVRAGYFHRPLALHKCATPCPIVLNGGFGRASGLGQCMTNN